mgnify:FL=1
MTRLIVFLFLVIFIELYAYRSIKTIFNSRIKILYIFLNSLIYLVFFIQIFFFYDRNFNLFFSYNLTLIFILFISKSIIMSFLLMEDFFRIISFAFNKVLKHKKTNLSRRSFVSNIALAIGSIPIPFMVHGVLSGRYNFKVIKHVLYFKDLPKNFDGFKITHVSDFHCGSLENKKKIGYGINLINEQKSDLILFTGDFVNNTFKEIIPWKKLLSKLKAAKGKFSVLGNHDYGDYFQWKSDSEKKKNFENLKNIQQKMGFNLLMDDSFYISKGDQKIALIGVENWGDGFKKKGDINKAISKIKENDFKVLMSHDPSHWEKIIIDHKNKFHLTLSGHTHGMQFGIEIPGLIKWSPVKYRYKYWAGVYEKKSQYINVNRGFGVLGFPGRIGIWPEISVIELRKS